MSEMKKILLLALAVTLLLGGIGVYSLVLRPRQQAHRHAVSEVALHEVMKAQDDEREEMRAAGKLSMGSPLYAYWCDLIAGGQIDSFTKTLYGEPTETGVIAARACAETAMRDAEKIVALSEAYGK
jgi:hypothetical protein